MQPIRILHCLGRMNRGGAETLVMNLYRNIDRNMVQFDFVVHTQEECAFDEEIKALGGRIYRVPRYNGRNHFMYKRAWEKLFQGNRDEWKYIHGHIYTTASIYLEIARRFGILTIAHSHNTSCGTGFKAFTKNMLQLPLRKRRFDYLFACSKAAGQWLYGDSNMHKVVVVNNAIDAHSFAFDSEIRDSLRRELGVEHKFVIGHVGRFQEQKNHKFLIEIFQEIFRRKPDSVLWLIGQGSLEDDIKRRVIEYGLVDVVRFMGVRPDVSTLMQAMDVFLFPSLFEGLPLTVIEAQAAGLPCYTSDTITNEVEITELVKPVSLKLPPGYWAEIIKDSLGGFKRRDTCFDIIDAGYDIKSTAKWLQDFYLQESRSNPLGPGPNEERLPTRYYE